MPPKKKSKKYDFNIHAFTPRLVKLLKGIEILQGYDQIIKINKGT